MQIQKYHLEMRNQTSSMCSAKFKGAVKDSWDSTGTRRNPWNKHNGILGVQPGKVSYLQMFNWL